MTWEETIQFARATPQYKDLIEQSYLQEDLILNVKRFSGSDEFLETLKLINEYAPAAKQIVDLGAGNGVASVSLALKGYEVIAVEPDDGKTVGCQAISIQKEKLNLFQLKVLKEYGESISLRDECCDVVYVRQAMHHASDHSIPAIEKIS